MGKNIGLWIADLSLAIWAAIQNVGIWFANLGLGIWGSPYAPALKMYRPPFSTSGKKSRSSSGGLWRRFCRGLPGLPTKSIPCLGCSASKSTPPAWKGRFKAWLTSKKPWKGKSWGVPGHWRPGTRAFTPSITRTWGTRSTPSAPFRRGGAQEAYGEGAQIGSGIKDWIGGLIDQEAGISGIPTCWTTAAAEAAGRRSTPMGHGGICWTRLAG